MPVFAFQAAGPAQLDTVAQRAMPSDGPRISWHPGATPIDGYYHIGDLHINLTTGNVRVCTTEGLVGSGVVFDPVGTQT